MDVLLIIVSILIIAIVLLQSGKAEDGGFLTGGSSSDLFKNRKERGAELFITRATIVLGVVYIALCLFI